MRKDTAVAAAAAVEMLVQYGNRKQRRSHPEKGLRPLPAPQTTARPLAVLFGDAAMGSPSVRFADKPRLAKKHQRALERALKRGRRSQIQRKLTAWTGVAAP